MSIFDRIKIQVTLILLYWLGSMFSCILNGVWYPSNDRAGRVFIGVGWPVSLPVMVIDIGSESFNEWYHRQPKAEAEK